MSQEVVKLWVDDLRSGLHKQTTERLADENGFCCLGRLSELFCQNVKDIRKACVVKKEIENWNEDETDVEITYRDLKCTEYAGELEALPQEVMEWAGLQDSTGRYNGPVGEFHSLAWLNDSGKTFAEIADIIESRPAGLFV